MRIATRLFGFALSRECGTNHESKSGHDFFRRRHFAVVPFQARRVKAAAEREVRAVRRPRRCESRPTTHEPSRRCSGAFASESKRCRCDPAGPGTYTWRESVGIEPTSPLAKASTVLKTERDTSPVLSQGPLEPLKTRVSRPAFRDQARRQPKCRHFADVTSGKPS
jgi:hypothetical protein